MSTKSPVQELPLGRHLAVLSKYYYGALTKMLEDSGIERYFTFILMIDSCPEKCTQQYLSNIGHIDKAQVTHIIDELLSKDLLIKEQNPRDRREYILKLSTKGLTLIPKIKAAIEELNLITFSNVSEADRETFMRVLCQSFQNISSLPAEPISFQFKPSKKSNK